MLVQPFAGGLTQFDSSSVVQSVTTNGTTFGNLTNISIDEQGYVTASFDNGITRRIAQVAIATFPNANGLRGINGNAYRVSQESGTYSLKAAGTGGAGFRFLYAAFLQEAAALLQKPALRDLSLQLTAIGDGWRDFALHAARMNKGRSEIDLPLLADCIEKLAGRERALFKALWRAV